MVGNLKSDNSGDILVEFDYDNIIIVDPNKTIDYEGNIKERLVDHENLIMYANLEAEVLPRTKLAVGGSPQDASRKISVAKINFLGPNKNDYFSTSYYDELTGKNTTVNNNGKYGFGTNQPTEVTVNSPKDKRPYNKQGVVTNGEEKSIDTGLLGIVNIQVKLTTSFIPSVSIELMDVQGKALFSLGDNSPYAAFLNQPYPPFYLTLKGYYGQAIRYQLNLEKFNARFNTFSGNYQVSLEFKGFKFSILNEIQLQHLLAAPHMFSTRYDLTNTSQSVKNIERDTTSTNQNVAQPSQLTGNKIVTSVVTERGYEKIVEVYSEYKTKGLLPQDFPELTFYQLIDSIQTFETKILDSYTKADVQPLTDCRTYRENLKKYYEVVYASGDSWFTRKMDLSPIILTDGTSVYIFKINTFNATERDDAVKQLEKIIEENNLKLANVGTLGVKGKAPIVNNIKLSTIKKDNFDLNKVDWVKSAQQRGIFALTPQSPSIENFKKNVEESLKVTIENGNVIRQPVFDFESFTSSMKKMETEVNSKQSNFETKITAQLAKKLEDPKEGLGFRPSIRNIIGIIMATTEGFIRLMDQVHKEAWNLRNDEIRRNAILNNNSSAPSSDRKQVVNFTNTASATAENSQEPIYPWPQFFVETNDDKGGRFQLKYLADPTVVDLTKADQYAKWPEVQFVEEYYKGLTQKFDPPIAQPPLETSEQTNLININAIEYPQSNVAYRNKDELKFFYQIWERQYVTSFFTGLGRTPNVSKTPLIELLQKSESQNIRESLGESSPYLKYKLKNELINADNFVEKLFFFSNQGTGRSWQDFSRDFFVTNYLRTLTNNSFSILQENEQGPIPQLNISGLNEELKKVIYTQSEPTVMDTYPFTNEVWCSTNLVGINKNLGNKKFNTNEVLTVFEDRNVISNFNNLNDNTFKRPVTNFSYLDATNPLTNLSSSIQIGDYYRSLDLKKVLPTVGTTFTEVPAKNITGQPALPFDTATSMLNTPYFVNSILKGVDNFRRNNKYPYKAAAYLFLNSLPLISLREKLKSKTTVSSVNGNTNEINSGLDDLNYMFASLKKFGAIHKLPYAWILKMGSIWHRYKLYKLSGIDILNDAWKNYDFAKQYDPINGDVTKTYTITIEGTEIKIQLQAGYSQTTNIQLGFYPKTINDFNVFYNGYDLFESYTDTEIQSAFNRGVQIHNFTSSNIKNVKNGNNSFNVQTWSVLLPANIEFSSSTEACSTEVSEIRDMFIIPSFGSKINEAELALTTDGVLVNGYAFAGNPSVFNGSVRLFWAAPNYGYFDTNFLKKPQTDEYINKFEESPENMSAFRFTPLGDYMKIDEVFSVFEKRILDSFEEEFLKFTKSSVDLETGQLIAGLDSNGVDINVGFKNFQLLMKNLMRVPLNSNRETPETYFSNTIDSQYESIKNQIASFLEYDIIFRYGNPSNFNKRIFESYLYPNGNGQIFVDPIEFEPYVEGSLPIEGGTTLQVSKSNYPDEWLELELEVGFSTIPQLVYKNSGSYITDFFIDNNIKFSVNNIRLLAPIIKIYATQKLQYNRTPSGVKFYLQEYLNQCQELQSEIIDGVMSNLRKEISGGGEVQEVYKQSVINGQQPKVEAYEMFKALNDKWIAGSDFESKTLFEDILFLDRASRNIGDTLLIDIFSLKNILKETSINPKMTVYVLISSIISYNNFNIMNLPAYVNFYNVQDVDGLTTFKPEGSSDFANSFWGTFMNVDYRNSSPKMVCFFAGKPSTYPSLPNNPYFRYRSDGFDFRRASEVPLIEKQQNKKDYALSNRCVGFNVDIGIRNQNVFYSFSVGQENGKATSETIQIQYDLINNVSGVQTATQNTGLYELYKSRSYPCTVECLGNAMLQPMMYFNLRNVPMFYGPYLILDVTHNISPGTFQTTFTGVRQGIFDLPQIDKYLQSINQNLLTKIESFIRQKKQETPITSTTNSGKAGEIAGGATDTKSSTVGSCNSLVLPRYLNDGYVNTEIIKTTRNEQEMILLVNQVILTKSTTGEIDDNIQRAIYSFNYFQNHSEADKLFIGWNNNYNASINLTKDYYPTSSLFEKTYSCLSVNNQNIPIANFESADRFISFLYDRLKSNSKRIAQVGLTKYMYCFFNPDSMSSDYFDSQKTTNESINQTNEKLRLALNNMNQLSTIDDNRIKKMSVEEISTILSGTTPTVLPGVTNNLNTTSNNEPTCETPTIISFEPLSAKTSGEMPKIILSGTNLVGNTIITLDGSGTTITPGTLTQTRVEFVPQFKKSGKIKVITNGGDATSEREFIFVNDNKKTTGP